MKNKNVTAFRRFIPASSLLLAALFISSDGIAAPQNKNTIIFNGPLGAAQGGAAAEIGPEQKQMFEASAKFVKFDYKGAEAAYTEVLQMNGRNINAYVQRGVVRRELGNKEGTRSDATMALNLIDAALRQEQGNANLYYERSLANRLLKQFDAAEKDLRMAMRLNASANWENDLKAIALERKMAQ